MLHGRRNHQKHPHGPGCLAHLHFLVLVCCFGSCSRDASGKSLKRRVPKVEAPAQEITGEAPYVGLLNKLRGIKVGDIDVGELATSAVNDLQSSVAGIKDEATAQAALPGLTKASSEFDQLTGLLGQLSPEARKTVTEVFAAIKPNLDQLLDRVLGIPGVGAIIKPAVDAIRAKLDSLATV